MNELIQELSEQAEKYADEGFKGEPTWSEAFESKFAELIIERCIKVVQDGGGMCGAISSNNLKQYFGIVDA